MAAVYTAKRAKIGVTEEQLRLRYITTTYHRANRQALSTERCKEGMWRIPESAPVTAQMCSQRDSSGGGRASHAREHAYQGTPPHVRQHLVEGLILQDLNYKLQVQQSDGGSVAAAGQLNRDATQNDQQPRKSPPELHCQSHRQPDASRSGPRW